MTYLLIKLGTNFKRNFSIILMVVVSGLLLNSTAQAHNKVVVIPMAGDDVQLEPFALIPNDNTLRSDYETTSATAVDKTTGLEWQRLDNNTHYTLDQAREYCFRLELGGKTDWRLPTVKELFSIVDLSAIGADFAAIDFISFPGADLERYWSTTNAPGGRNVIDFSIGRTTFLQDAGVALVRCVRSNGKNALVQVFKANGDGSVADLASGLVWQQGQAPNTLNHADAISYCANLVLAGSSDWRLPEAKELLSLVDYRNASPAIDSQVFPETTIRYWSASRVFGNFSSAWFIFFGGGTVSTLDRVRGAIDVRCVR